MKRGTKHSTGSGDGSQGDGEFRIQGEKPGRGFREPREERKRPHLSLYRSPNNSQRESSLSLGVVLYREAGREMDESTTGRNVP